jgi:hypothetical protein
MDIVTPKAIVEQMESETNSRVDDLVGLVCDTALKQSLYTQIDGDGNIELSFVMTVEWPIKPTDNEWFAALANIECVGGWAKITRHNNTSSRLHKIRMQGKV